jgi:hypothetical protein
MNENAEGEGAEKFDLGSTDYNGAVEFEYQPDIVTNRDRLFRLFTDNIRYVNIGIVEWTVPASFALTLLLTLITSSSKKTWGIDGSTWDWILIILFIGSTLWLIFIVVVVIKNKKSINDMIDIIESNQTGKVIRH